MMTHRLSTVGVVGLGLMGQAFVKRLDEAHVPVIGTDVSATQCEQFGLHRVTTIPQMAQQAHVVILAVFNTQQVEEILLSEQGLCSPSLFHHPLHIVCTSTCDPAEIKAIGLRCIELGHSFLELPISGTSKQLAQGDCLGLMGGSEQTIEKLNPYLDIITPNRQLIGDIGDASKAKLAINLVLGLHRAALAEGLCFGKQLGLDTEKLLATLQKSAASSAVMKVKGPLMVKREYDNPQSKVDQSLKDFGMIWDLGNQMNQHLPLTEIYIKLLKSQQTLGYGQADNAIIHEAILLNVLKQ